MGWLSEGTPLTWKEIEENADYVRRHGIKQFINVYKNSKNRQNDSFYWGDEVEYLLLKFDHEKRTCQLLMNATELLEILHQAETQSSANPRGLWHPEYAEFMLESCPGKPYGSQCSDFNYLEESMRFRREQAKQLLSPNEALSTFTSFPRIGCSNFTYPVHKPEPYSGEDFSHSLFFSEAVITSSHPRFKSFSESIAGRRKEKPAINIPIFKDKNTLSPFVENFTHIEDNGQIKKATKVDHIYMDAVGFGFSCCCLQTTIQASNIQEAFIIFDNLAPICPIMIALSAAAPIFRGYLADFDCRWNVLSQSVDDRTEEERGIKPLKNGQFLINKSRWDSINNYLSEMGRRYNDIEFNYDKEIFEQLKNAGVEDLFAKHIAYLFIRDPVYLLSENLQRDGSKDTDLFENIQSTNWQFLRFKPPPPNSNIGWRVEFRPMDVQLSDFENAAYVVFIVLVTRAILTFKLNFLIPISKNDENMISAQKKDAVKDGKFYFRKDVKFSKNSSNFSPNGFDSVLSGESKTKQTDEEYDLMSINEIINGKSGRVVRPIQYNKQETKGDNFPGLIPLVNTYLQYNGCDVGSRCKVQQYLQLISDRASGKLMTMAQWIRKFVLTHADYNHDSVINESINYDLLVECEKIASGEKACPELFFKYSTRTRDDIPAAVSKAEANLNRKISAAT